MHCVDCGRGKVAPTRDSSWRGHTSPARARRGTPATRRSLDAHRWDGSDSPGVLEGMVTTWRPGDSYSFGDHGCRPGHARTGRLVRRCPPFWMEAHRPANPKELDFLPLSCYSAHTSKGYSFRSQLVYTAAPSGVAGKRQAIQNTRCETNGFNQGTTL